MVGELVDRASVHDERFHLVSARRTDDHNTCGGYGQRGSPRSRPRCRHGSRNGGFARTTLVLLVRKN